jgi:ABC-type Fe3+-siderophore transport system permease subunit
MSDERRGGGGFGGAFVLLIFVGAIVKFWVWIAVAFGAAVVFGVLLWLAFYAARRVDAREDARLATVARADRQHAWVLAGDDRGVYGEHIPAQID